MSKVCCSKAKGKAAAKAKTTVFRLHAPTAKKVSLAGSFNNWDPSLIIAKKDLRGTWAVKVSLNPGNYEYKFFVDGNWMADPKCSHNVSNSFGSLNSIVEIK